MMGLLQDAKVLLGNTRSYLFPKTVWKRYLKVDVQNSAGVEIHLRGSEKRISMFLQNAASESTTRVSMSTEDAKNVVGFLNEAIAFEVNSTLKTEGLQ